jgi:hypothetical protein
MSKIVYTFTSGLSSSFCAEVNNLTSDGSGACRSAKLLAAVNNLVSAADACLIASFH